LDSQLSATDETFRREVRSFLNENLSEELREAGRKKTSIWQEINSAMAWQKMLFDKGWVAPEWPLEYGGTDWSLTQRYIFSQECARAETPSISPMGLKMCGPMLIGYGTEKQKNYYLPKIMSGEHIWCQGYSEPGAGSDLASLKTFAASEGNDYIVNATLKHDVRTGQDVNQRQGSTGYFVPADRHGHTRNKDRTYHQS
jgi:alkylation response protein AidB-like acyl-CoA dehydrogenase